MAPDAVELFHHGLRSEHAVTAEETIFGLADAAGVPAGVEVTVKQAEFNWGNEADRVAEGITLLALLIRHMDGPAGETASAWNLREAPA